MINKLNKIICVILFTFTITGITLASSHREAPLISSDPLADNVDLYAFRSPDNDNTITLIATYVPMQLPQGGPNYYGFGENIRYEIHVDNDAAAPGDEIIYRFTFTKVNEDPTTFFNIRLGQQNQKTTYTLERSLDGGMSFATIIENGIVPPNNIGPRSIEGMAGLNTTYEALHAEAITTASSGELVFAGPTDDPFFVDLGGIFDLGDAPRQNGTPVDDLACLNVSAIAIQVPINTLLKAGAPEMPSSILDPDYVIGVWASASRPAITTLSQESNPQYDGDWIQVSRLGMPLTNEAVIPIGMKDFWNSITPYDEIGETSMDEFFYNPELALYMDDDLFGAAVPGFSPLRVQTNSLGAFDFSNGADGLFGLKGSDAVTGTALDDNVFGTLLLPDAGKPRSVDLWPAFHTGVPNVIPYQLATGKEGNPLAAGKPFVHNFLPNGGDMLRLNMAVPVTNRQDESFSSLGLVQAAVLGLTTPPFNTNTDIEFIPNMDGFPNGRRLEDDVTRIELQAVGGIVLAAVGLWYDDFDPNNMDNPVTEQLINVLTYSTGVEQNDLGFRSSFPYLALPHSGTGPCSGELIEEDGVEANSLATIFASSNNSGMVGILDYNDDNTLTTNTFPAAGQDADGIYYDEDNDVLYQLNRSNNVVDIYGDVLASIENGTTPTLITSSTSDFVNGREIAVSGDKLVVAQDANDGNNNTNRFVVYNISPNSITFDKYLETDKNLWGLFAVGGTLYAIEDNSDRVLIYDNFFNQPEGAIVASQVVTVEGIVRTHGITYATDGDLMVLTDVADAGSDSDGGVSIIYGFTQAASDNIISASEQIRIAGPMSNLGNPVDVAVDQDNNVIYVAERANEGGQILVFEIPAMSGDYSPVAFTPFMGASAVYFEMGNQPVNPMMEEVTFFVSSNTQNQIGTYNIDASGNYTTGSFRTISNDADGIYYDMETDNIYQVNRVTNAVNVYGNVTANLANGASPMYMNTSAAEFSNGRELAFSRNRIVVAQDANDGNSNQNRFVIFDVNGTSLSLIDRLNTSINLWGIHLDGETLYAIVDNSNELAIFKNFFGNNSSSVEPNSVVSIEGLVRTHGISYIRDRDLMLLTDVGEASSADDGAVVIVNNFSTAIMDGSISLSEQTRIEGPMSTLGNPVDIALDRSRNLVFIAERANEGGKVLAFPLSSPSGDTSPVYSSLFDGASAIHIPSEFDINDDDILETQAQLFASSNVSRTIGVYNILEQSCIIRKEFLGVATDADGIYYNSDSDRLLQLNRTNNAINAYRNVNASINNGVNPSYAGTSIAEVMNGREIAVGNGMVIAAQDANDGNGNQNSLHFFQLNGEFIEYDREVLVDINLWGLHLDGDMLFAIIDNSSQVAIFENIFEASGSITPDWVIDIQNMVRTHGITYDATTGTLFLTDVGEASSADDGAIVVIENFIDIATMEGFVNENMQVRIEGTNTFLGNPVDIAWDADRSTIYVAERANGGGRILAFENPTMNGNPAPVYNNIFPGASAVYFSGVNGGAQVVPRSDATEMVVNQNNGSSQNAFAVDRMEVEEKDENIQRIKVSPNPAEDFINIDLEGFDDSYNGEILNIYGQKVIDFDITTNNVQLSLGNFEAGAYYVLVTDGNKKVLKKFLKIR